MKTAVIIAIFLSSTSQISASPFWARQAQVSASYVSGDGSEAPYAGATSADVFPPTGASPNTAAFPAYSDVGYFGPTTTGAEPFAIQTAAASPQNTKSFSPLVAEDQEIFRQWGNLSPWYSVNSSAYGLPNASPVVPSGCALTQVHILFRHGARYPTVRSESKQNRIKSASFTATGELEFLNKWEYLLGAEVLTPWGRQQNFDLGVAFRMGYGHLLNNFTEAGTLPVFRTESQDRMVKTALNFAAGFFGIPYEDQFNLEIQVEAKGFNNSGASYETCPNSNTAVGTLGTAAAAKYAATAFASTAQRLQQNLQGYNLTATDVVSMLQLCAYETQALGYSAFCNLFSSDDFAKFETYFDISFYYNNFMGSPVAAAQGKGWTEELLARLTQTQIVSSDATLNTTLDSSPITFPLNNSIYAVDYSSYWQTGLSLAGCDVHEVIVCDVLAALNLTALLNSQRAGDQVVPLSGNGSYTYVASQTVPFATHLTVQVLDCEEGGQQIRFIVNDAVVPITNYPGCSYNENGMCSYDTVVSALQQRMGEIDVAYACNGTYNATAGNNYNGLAPRNSTS